MNFSKVYCTLALLLISFFHEINCFPKAAKGGSKSGGSVSKGVSKLVKGVTKSKGSSSSSSSGSSSFFTSPPPIDGDGSSTLFSFNWANHYPTSTTNKPTTKTPSTTQIPDNLFYENIRTHYCHKGSKISLEEIESALTCSGNGFSFKLFSELTALANMKINLSENVTTIINSTNSTVTTTSTPNTTDSLTLQTTTTTPILSNITEIAKLTNQESNMTINGTINVQHVLENLCGLFNATCLGKMHHFFNECLSEDTSPIGEAYQFDLHLAEKSCVQNNTEQIDEWVNGTEKCLSPYFANKGEKLLQAIAECKRRSSISNSRKITYEYSSRISACVKDRIRAPLCVSTCKWGTSESGCNPLASILRKYYLDSVISLNLFYNRTQ